MTRELILSRVAGLVQCYPGEIAVRRDELGTLCSRAINRYKIVVIFNTFTREEYLSIRSQILLIWILMFKTAPDFSSRSIPDTVDNLSDGQNEESSIFLEMHNRRDSSCQGRISNLLLKSLESAVHDFL